MDIVIAIAAGLLGVLAGGVINALADDLPHRRKPERPHYPDGTPRPFSAWLGLSAFLTGQREPPDDALPSLDWNVDSPLGGGERSASRRLSWRHPLVEIVMGGAFAAMSLAFAGEPNLPAWLVYVAIMALITVIDVEHRLILFVVIVPSCLFALAVAAVSPEGGKPFSDFLIGGALAFALFFAMFLGGGAFSAFMQRDEVAFGFGDVMLATLSGFILGWRAFIFAALITVFVGAAGAVLYLMGRMLIRRRYKWFTPLPYGPYIVIGTLIMLLFRDEVARLLGGG